MKKSSRPSVAARKKPLQQRSASLVADLLEAAVRVLQREGARRFTTVRVAERAGVSVGSLYQYFPNKEALLFRLQADEWETTWSNLEQILGDQHLPPRVRLRRAVLAFFRSERDEAHLRVALDDAGALFRDSPEAKALRAKATARMRAFAQEFLPRASPAARAFAGDYVLTVMVAVAEQITAQGRSHAEVEAWAATTGDLLCGFLEKAPRSASKKRVTPG